MRRTYGHAPHGPFRCPPPPIPPELPDARPASPLDAVEPPMEVGRFVVTFSTGVGVALTLGAVEYDGLAGGVLETLTAIAPTSLLVAVGVATPPRVRLALLVVPIATAGKLTATGGAGATSGTKIGPGTAVRCSCGNTAMVTPATMIAASAASPAQSANPRVMDTLYH